MKRTNQEGLKARIFDALELPKDIVLDLPRITVTGKVGAFIENHKGILEYSSDRVCINTKLGPLVIKGQDLIIKSVVADEIVVEGKIRSLEFEE
ncbi:sporulation protein YqfC [Thermosediminibacter litoriperuensis]|uniref:Sporulation protein YqfC n=1 Tax=Thermosediminibacter litoriperuensis TaxID=291989 RepID=A0A5S5AVE3_9FIRM|nr:sporulation protein YqfC [Thermosediminibacter litoriperuensis]TYP54976.1 sporulation protein YqfC [Thermosediminibacter litoriperuensis]